MASLEKVFEAFVEHGDIRDLTSALYACERGCPEASEADVWVAWQLGLGELGELPFEEVLASWRNGEYFIEMGK